MKPETRERITEYIHHASQYASAWLLVLVLLASGFGFYAFIYVRGRQQYHTQKRLFKLAELARGLEQRIENIANNVLPNAVTAATGNAAKPQRPCRSLGLKTVVVDGLTTTVSTDTGQPLIFRKTAGLAVNPGDALCDFESISQLTSLIPGFTLERALDYRRGSRSASVRVEVRRQEAGAAALFSYTAPLKGRTPSSSIWLRGAVPLQGMFRPHDDELFEQLLIADQAGVVLAHFGDSPASVQNLASLIAAPSDASDDSPPTSSDPSTKQEGSLPSSSWTAAGTTSGIRARTIAGEEYLLFLQPVELSLIGSTGEDDFGGTTRPTRWTVTGLVRQDRVSRESFAISYSVVLGFLLVFSLVLVALPFLKVVTLGEFDWLRLRDVVAICFSAVLTLGFLTFFLADIYAYNQLEQLMDDQLKQLAQQIRFRFNTELDSVLPVLQELGQQPPPPQEESPPSLLEEPEGDPITESLSSAVKSGAFVDMAVWIDSQGQQQRKRTIAKRNTPSISVREREYFKKVRDGRLWTRTLSATSPKGTTAGGTSISYWMEQIESRNTGETLTTLSGHGPLVSEVAGETPRRWVISLTVDLPSLSNPVLPPGYGFAVLGENGSVLFHSDLPRHSRESFIRECDDDPDLRAALFARSSELINLSYGGTDHRLFTLPLGGEADRGRLWTLVVFRDKLPLRTANLEVLSVALILFVVLFLFLVPIFLLVWVQDTGWMWPSQERTGANGQFLLFMLGVLALFVAAILGFSRAVLLSTTFVIPPVVLVAAYAMLNQSPKVDRARAALTLLLAGFPSVALLSEAWIEKQLAPALMVIVVLGGLLAAGFRPSFIAASKRMADQLGLRWSYVLTIAAVLISTAVLPALALFRIAYEKELNLFVRHGQFHLYRMLQAREERLEEKYRAVPRSLQLKNDRLEKGHDVYQNFFFPCDGTGAEVVSNRWGLGSLRAMRPLYNQVAIESHGLAQDAADDSHRWKGAGEGCVRLESSSPLALRPVSVQAPSWWPRAPLLAVLPLLFGVILVLVVVYLSEFIARWIFLLEVKWPAGSSKPLQLRSAEIWRSCQPAEKLALLNLATEGFLNKSNRAVPKLLIGGLLRCPPIQFFSHDFRDFVRDEAEREEVHSLERKAPSPWQQMKWPLSVVLLAVGTFLFVGERRLFDTGIGLIGALASAIPSLLSVFSALSGHRAGPPTGSSTES